MKTINELAKNYVLLVAVISWASAQLLKFLIAAVFTKKFNIERLIGSGGMPSAHSALVSSMVLGVARTSGISSGLFAVSCLLAFVVLYDSMGVRREAGEQAKILNKIVDNWDMDAKDYSTKELKEYIGHTPLEVLAGSMLGIIVCMIVPK